MVYYNFKKHKEFFYLDLIVYLIPISIILGNLIINILSVICFFIFIEVFTQILVLSILLFLFSKNQFPIFNNYPDNKFLYLNHPL